MVPEIVTCAVDDRQAFQNPDHVQLSGWIGMRVAGNASNRLAKIDTGRLLEGYRKRPGRHPWDGEHVGKWLHAATLAWVYTGDVELRKKIDEVAAELCACQLADGYLGTYLDTNRWTGWDVWAHKYNLIGLITYVRYTGNRNPLPTCRRMADLLCATFGDDPGRRDIVPCGTHIGMASTSVLEPMVLLYRLTGDPKYLAFCKYILRTWEQPNGPHIVSRLLSHKRVDKVGDAKAYEMLSCLNGALELYRTIGDRTLLEATLNAWCDIVDYRLYITGASSYWEVFHDNYDLPNINSVGETCVTVTWLQFNAQLLRLTGEARFAEQLERVALNQLFGAQKPDGTAWGYYVQMEGTKPYSAKFDGHCCLSSGPRGIAMLPTFAVTTDADGAVVNLFDQGIARLTLNDGTSLTLMTETRYPADGKIRISLELKKEKSFAVKLRIPTWCSDWSVSPMAGANLGSDGYLALNRTWQSGDVIELTLSMTPRLVLGDHLNRGKAALCYGPLVLAADESLMAGTGITLRTASFASGELASLGIVSEPAPEEVRTWTGAKILRVGAMGRRDGKTGRIGLVPFADAGATGSQYKVWLPLPGMGSQNVLLYGDESRSRQGNRSDSINDDEPLSFVVTFDGRQADEDWFCVTLDKPTTISRVRFAHGKCFHDGGWFVGKPRVQILRKIGGEWETAGVLDSYPATTATDNKRLAEGQEFTFHMPKPVRVQAVRIIGVPASGDDLEQAFASCGELQAFEK